MGSTGLALHWMKRLGLCLLKPGPLAFQKYPENAQRVVVDSLGGLSRGLAYMYVLTDLQLYFNSVCNLP